MPRLDAAAQFIPGITVTEICSVFPVAAADPDPAGRGFDTSLAALGNIMTIDQTVGLGDESGLHGAGRRARLFQSDNRETSSPAVVPGDQTIPVPQQRLV